MNLDLELLREIVAALPDPVFVLTESGRYAAIVGGSDPEYYHDGSGLIGLRLHDVLPPEKADWFLTQIQSALQDNRLCVVEYGLAGADVDGLDAEGGPAGELWFEGRIQPLSPLVDGERAVVWVARNITRRHRLESELRLRSETDELTGAPNRRRLLAELRERFQEFHRYGHPVSVLMLDIDNFKRLNDRYGHVVGDRVLCELTRLCTEHLRSVDTLARFGGEEFAVLLPNTTVGEACRLADRLRQSIAESPMALDAETGSVTVSVGVSAVRAADPEVESVIKRADDALYAAKRAGRNRIDSLP